MLRAMLLIAFGLLAAAFAPPAALAQPAGYAAFPAGAAAQADNDYRIRPLDKISIVVFQVRELTLERLQVDSSGQLGLPLVGSVNVAGRTALDVQGEIASRLRQSYLRNPQVTVIVAERAPRRVTVQGAVMEAGVFEMRGGQTSLAEAVSLARGLSRTADPTRVAIVRTINGQPHAAIFDLDAINTGRAQNPQVLPDDTIYVADSGRRVAWRSFIETMPVLSMLLYLGL